MTRDVVRSVTEPTGTVRPTTRAYAAKVERRRSALVAGASTITTLFVLLGATAVFWRTAYPTITWWDSSGYSLAAATLGIYSPPGSLLLTLIGWPIARLAGAASAAHALALLAGVLASVAVALVYVSSTCALQIASGEARIGGSRDLSAGASLGAAYGALTLAFSGTLWTYAVMFTPYVLSALFTAIILWTMLRWWDSADAPDAWRWLGVLGLELGLDFSVHRTNALLIPAAVLWVLLRQPRTLRSARSAAAATGGLAIGLSFQLALIPVAAHTRSPLDFALPDTFARLWDYVSLKQLGGSFLLDLFPRKAPLWHVQSMDLLRVLAGNYLHWRGGMGLLGVVPAAAGLLGLAWLWRRDPRLGAAFTVLVLLQSAFTVLYFDIPANFFRTFDRHYLPVCITIGVLVACGLGVAGDWLARRLAHRRPALALAPVALLAVVPASQLAVGWRTHDASRRYFTHDYAANALRGLPPHAIYFTVGDNDTFPVWCVQSVEGVRPDVTIINLSVANVPEWPERLRRRDPSLPLSLSQAQRQSLAARPWTDTTLVLPVHGTPAQFDLPAAATLPASLTLHVQPVSGDRMLPAEIVLLDILRTNDWRRPLTFAVTGTRRAMEWLAPYGRLDGMYYRVVPMTDPPPNAALLRANLLQNARYRGYADPGIPVDDVSRTLGLQPYAGATVLLEADAAARRPDQCRSDQRIFLRLLPPARLSPPAALLDSLMSACASTGGGAVHNDPGQRFHVEARP